MKEGSSTSSSEARPEQLLNYAALFLAGNLLACALIGFLMPKSDTMFEWKNLPKYLKYRSESVRSR
jgi:hypothetical protein